MQSIVYPNTFRDEDQAKNSAINFGQPEFIGIALGVFISGMILLLGADAYAVGFLMVWLIVLCLINIFRSTESALYIFAFLLPYEQLIFRYGVGRYNTLSYLALVILFLCIIVFKSLRFFKRLEIEELILLLFVTWAFLSGLWIHTLKGAVEASVTVIGGVVCFFLFSRGLIDRLSLRRVVWFYVLGVLFLGTFSLLNYSAVANIQRGAEDSFDWVPSTLGWASGVTSVLLARATAVGVIGAIFVGSMETERKRKLLVYSLAFLLGLYTILTGNRSANYGLFIALLIWVIFGGRISTKARKVLIAVVLVSVAVLAGFAINKGALETRLVETTFESHISADNIDDPGAYTDAVFSGRVKIWEESLKIFEKNPWTGVGLGQFQYEFALATGEARGAHNTYLELLVETGIVGLFIFILFLLAILFRAWQCGAWRSTSLSWFILIVLSISVQSLDRGKEYWLVMGLTCAMVRLQRRELDALDSPPLLHSRAAYSRQVPRAIQFDRT